MHELIQKYGAQTISELLDMVIIQQNISNDDWRMFLVRNGIIKDSTKIIRGYMNSTLIRTKYVTNAQTGRWESIRLDNPYMDYSIRCKNGRGVVVFTAQFVETDIPQIMRELQTT